MTARRGGALVLVATLTAAALSSCGSSPPKDAPGTAPVVSAPVRVAHVPVTDDHVLASLISGSQLKLYPDAGHAFLFQDWSSFAALVNSFR